MFIFGFLASRKCDFCSFVNRSCEVKDLGYSSVGIRNIYKDHLILTIMIARKFTFQNSIYKYVYAQYTVYVRRRFHSTV